MVKIEEKREKVPNKTEVSVGGESLPKISTSKKLKIPNFDPISYLKVKYQLSFF